MNAIRIVEGRSAAGDTDAAALLPELLGLLQQIRRGGALPEPTELEALLGPLELEDPGLDDGEPALVGGDGSYDEDRSYDDAAPEPEHETIPPDPEGDDPNRTSAA